jgi:DNA-binding transcriptional LysR family regulator
MSDRLQELAVFARAAESGSFSRTARELNLSQPSVSRIVSALESRLGVKLLLRTTRRITVTDAGAIFLDRARDILSGLEDAEDAARGADSLRGVIRLALPVVYGTREIVPRLPDFLTRHPLLRMELIVADEVQNLVAEGADVAIRIGRLSDSPFGARKLATLQRRVVASPVYLKAHGIPKTPADLAGHDCIFGPGPAARQSWSFRRGGTSISVDVHGRIQTNSGPALFASVMAGLGITVASDAMCRAQIQSGELVALLKDYALDPVDVHAVFPGGPRPSAKVRALVDYLESALKSAA